MTPYTNNQSINLVEHDIYAVPENKILDNNVQKSSYRSSEEIHIKDIFSSAKKQKIVILLIVALSLFIAYLYTKTIKPIYRAGISIQIDSESDSIEGFNIYKEKIDSQHFYQTQYDLLKSRSLARSVIDKMKLDDYYLGNNDSDKPSINKIIPTYKLHQKTLVESLFLKNLIISPSKKSNIVTIYYNSYDPNLSANVANALVESYIKKNLDKSEKSIAHAKKFLQEQLSLAKDRLEHSEKSLIIYAREKQIFGETSKTSIGSVEFQNTIQAYSDAKNKLIAIESEYRQKYKLSGSMQILDNNVIQELKNRRSILKYEYDEKLQIYKPTSTIIVGLKQQLSYLEKEINKESLLIKKGVSGVLKNSYLAAKRNVDILKDALEENKIEQLSYRNKKIGYQTLEREVKTNRVLYDGLLQKMKEISVGSKIVPNNISVVDKAFPPLHPFKPDLKKNLILASVLGLSLGLLLAFFLDKKSGKLSSVEEVEHFTKHMVLGIFPWENQKTNKGSQLILNDAEKNYGRIKEAFRTLAFNVKQLINKKNKSIKIINIVSSAPDEGKSSTCINLATVLAQNSKKILLIDADMRKPTLHDSLQLRNYKGLSNVISGQSALDDSIRKVKSVSGLYLLPAGSMPKNPVKILESQNFIKILSALSSIFDYIIVDSPPVLGMTDSLIISNRADATLFVFASAESNKVRAKDSLRLLSRTYANVVGMVLTKYKKSSKKKMKSSSYFYSHKSYTNNIGEDMEPASKLILTSKSS